jgi:hypothetical protein
MCLGSGLPSIAVLRQLSCLASSNIYQYAARVRYLFDINYLRPEPAGHGSRLPGSLIVYRDFRFSHRVVAASRAISLRRLADMPLALALPPIRPSATAAAFLPSSVVTSSISPPPSKPAREGLASFGRDGLHPVPKTPS